MPTPWDFVDNRMDSGRDESATRDSKQGAAGEYGQGGPQAPLNGDVPADTYPNVFNYGMQNDNSQFTSDKTGDPQTLSDQADGGAFYDLQNFLNNSSYTAGSRVCHEQGERDTTSHPSAPGAGDGKTGPA